MKLKFEMSEKKTIYQNDSNKQNKIDNFEIRHGNNV